MTFSRLGAELGKAAFKNPKGAAKVAQGFRNTVGADKIDEFMGALLQQATRALQPVPNKALQILKGVASTSLPLGIGVGATYAAMNALGGGSNNDGGGNTTPPSSDNSSQNNPPSNPNANTNNSNTGTTAFQSGQVSDPTGLGGYVEGLIDLARQRQAQFDTINSPAYLDAASARQRDAKLAVNQQVLESIEERTRENSRRQESISRINAWKAIEQETIRANTAIAQSLASIAYTSSVPNAGTLSALSPVVQAGAGAFKPGASVLPPIR